MHSSIYKHENQINLNKRPVQKNRCKGRLFILIEQLNYLEAYSQWLVSNFIPMDSKKFEFRKFVYIIRFAIKNESEIEKFRSRDQWIVGKNRF